MLNFIWSGFFLLSFIAALYQTFFNGQTIVFSTMLKSTFEMSKLGFELSLGLTGVMAFWLGIMKVGEKSGLINLMAKLFYPLLKKFFPEIPESHPAISSLMLNFTANFLGIDNAATPFGLKAMQQLQELNPNKKTASNAQIMFLVINTSAVTLIPISVFTYLYELGFQNPTEVFFPILMATFCSTLVGVSVTCVIQKIPLIRSGILLLLGLGASFIVVSYLLLKKVPAVSIQSYSLSISSFLIFGIIIFFIGYALLKKVDVYEAFIEGAKDGFQIAVGIIPYLITMLVGIGVFKASGCLDLFISFISTICDFFNMLFFKLGLIEQRTHQFKFVSALPTAFMKPLSGSGARAMMTQTIQEFGVNSIVSKMVAVIQGSTETTFYILAVYFGSVKIRFTRYAALVGLTADLAGIVAAIIATYLFFPDLS